MQFLLHMYASNIFPINIALSVRNWLQKSRIQTNIGHFLKSSN